jgi:predicted nucleic acid-binding protein
MKRLAILDTTILSNFAMVKRPDLIFSLWLKHACTTSAVMREYLETSDKVTYQPSYWKELNVLELTDQEETFCQQLSTRLGVGERTCIAVAIHSNALFVSDDQDARRSAMNYAIQVSGTLGILIACTQQNLLSVEQANKLLAFMIISGFHSPIEKIIKNE